MAAQMNIACMFLAACLAWSGMAHLRGHDKEVKDGYGYAGYSYSGYDYGYETTTTTAGYGYDGYDGYDYSYEAGYGYDGYDGYHGYHGYGGYDGYDYSYEAGYGYNGYGGYSGDNHSDYDYSYEAGYGYDGYSYGYGYEAQGNTTGLIDQSCLDTEGLAQDVDGNACHWYELSSHECGRFDDGDFSSTEMCCACTTTTTTTDVLHQGEWHRQCGVPGKSGQGGRGRIVHGDRADGCVWRWQVSLRTVHNGEASHFCGGTLIDEKWVLTAAHCVQGMNECGMQHLVVVAGDHNKDSEEEAIQGVSFEVGVARVITHPKYEVDSQSDHDFALIELAAEVPITECIGTACLPESEHEPGEGCSITGWGTLKSGGRLPHLLQEASVTTQSNEACQDSYANSTITDSMLCAQGMSSEGVTDSCQGDSGGPLVCEEGGRFVLRGVTSWGYGCADKQFPGVYGRVSYVLGWVKGVISGKIEVAESEEEENTDIDFGDAMWAVVSGPCEMDNSSCITSPNFPNEYSNFDTCRIAVNSSVAVPIEVENFSTEVGYDNLMIDCQAFSGSDGPQGVIPATDILWLPDSSIAGTGWKLCPSS